MAFGSRSMATTSPVEPTSRATSIATSPTPDPRSRTRCPSPMPASRKNLWVMGATRAACRISRSCSASVLPSGYSAERWLVVIVAEGMLMRSLATNIDYISHHQFTAVDVERGTGDVAGGLGGGEANQIGDFEGGAEARHGITCGETFEQLVRGMFASQLGIDHAGADGVYGDAELAELFRGRARQSEKSGLRCRVVRTAERAHHPAGRGRDINDAAVVLGAHCRKNGFRHQERRGKVDLDHSTPFLGGEIGEACRQRKRGVVDEDVDPSEACERAARDLLGDAVRRDVARHSKGPLADFLRQRLGALPVADVHRDQGAALVQARGRSPSEATPGTGDYSDASRKISVFHLGSQDPIVADARDANAQ